MAHTKYLDFSAEALISEILTNHEIPRVRDTDTVPLRDLIADIESREMTLTVINTPSDIVDDLREQFADRNIAVTAREVDHEPTQFAILRQQDTFVTAVPIDELQTTEEPGEAEDTPPSERGRGVLDHLEETLFTSYSIKQMYLASREIEDRAWRMGRGELHAGFQTLSVLADQVETYTQLGSHSDLSVHTYAAPDDDQPVIPQHEEFALHVVDNEEIRKTWFVAYDGGGVAENKCALLAEERGDREFYGFWTYDANTVDYLLGYLRSNYGSSETHEERPDNDSSPV